jgi:hypothetical protein
MPIPHGLKAAAVAAVLVTIPAVGIASIPNRTSGGLHTGISIQGTPGSGSDSPAKPSPEPTRTVVKYVKVPVPQSSDGFCKVTFVVGPSPAPAPTDTPYAVVNGLKYTHSAHVVIPCPLATTAVTPTVGK